MIPLVIFVVATFVYVLWFVRSVYTVRGKIKLHNFSYTYYFGDFIDRYGGRHKFNGLDILLPKKFPHIYIDAHNGEWANDQQFRIDRQNRLSLEGDFDKSYQVFAPKKYKTLALSILTPDVMIALRDSPHTFDIEYIGRHLRIITGQKLKGNKQLQKELLDLAGVVLREIDYKLTSWNDTELGDVEDRVLDLKEQGVIKLGKRLYVSTEKLATIYIPILVFCVFIIVGTVKYYSPDASVREFGGELLAMGFIFLATTLSFFWYIKRQ